MTDLSIGFSPCPNDTYMFYAIMHGLIPDVASLRFRETIDDVEALNKLALAQALDVTKVSYAVLGHIREHYVMLRAGSALGHGCGPLLVQNPTITSKKNAPVAIPGEHTTAALLLALYTQGRAETIVMPFHEIPHAIARGEVARGVIIHETRFTYQNFGLELVQDLGLWWEETTKLPLPLGGIVARRSLPACVLRQLEQGIQKSILYSKEHPTAAASFIAQHAQEMDPAVCRSHIQLYVNTFSENLGDLGEQAVHELLERGIQAGHIPRSKQPLFLSGD